MSPDGLALSDEQFWRLTFRRFHLLMALRQDRLYRWGIERAMYANAHIGKDTPAFTPEDFVYGGREQRIAMLAVDKMKADMLTAQLMTSIPRPGVTPYGLPEWAIGPYQGKN